MSGLKGLLLAACFVTAAPVGGFAAFADTAASPAAVKVAKADDADAKTSDADKRAKAADCSKQADEKKLHGAERKKFREACKRK